MAVAAGGVVVVAALAGVPRGLTGGPLVAPAALIAGLQRRRPARPEGV